MKMPSNELEKKREKIKAILFAEKSYTIYATIYDYHDQDDKALRFGPSFHISKLSADTFWYFFQIVKDDCLDDDFSIGLEFEVERGHCKIKIDANIEV